MPGLSSLHNQMSAQDPDLDVFEKASKALLEPQKREDTITAIIRRRSTRRPNFFEQDSFGTMFTAWHGFPNLSSQLIS